MILAVGEGIAYILSGAYGSLDQIGTGNAMLILLQLTISSFIVILLDEMLEHYGLGSGISLFIAANMCELIVWKSLSPITIRSEYGTEFEGSLIALIHFLLTKPNKISALYQAFFRTSSPNLASLVATILIFFLVIYLQSWKVDLTLVSKKYRGYTSSLPIRLFYTSNISVIFQSAFVENIYFLSSILYKRFRGNPIVGLFGTWEERNGVNIPIRGLAYWISPPRDIVAFVSEPLHSLIFTVFVMATCAISLLQT
jgi:protein transport protein SEC61 subunit alpha